MQLTGLCKGFAHKFYSVMLCLGLFYHSPFPHSILNMFIIPNIEIILLRPVSNMQVLHS